MRELDQRVWALSDGRRALVDADVLDDGVSKSQLATDNYLNFAVELRVKFVDLALQKCRIMRLVYVVVRMRSCYHRLDAVARRHPAHLHGLFERTSAVINSRKYMAVYIDHRAWWACAELRGRCRDA